MPVTASCSTLANCSDSRRVACADAVQHAMPYRSYVARRESPSERGALPLTFVVPSIVAQRREAEQQYIASRRGVAEAEILHLQRHGVEWCGAARANYEINERLVICLNRDLIVQSVLDGLSTCRAEFGH